MTHRFSFVVSSVLLSFALAACGGSIAPIPEPDDNGTGNGGGGGGSGTGSSGGTAVCMAYPSCDPGDREVKSCVPDSYCYTRSMCGVQIVCTHGDTPGSDALTRLLREGLQRAGIDVRAIGATA